MIETDLIREEYLNVSKPLIFSALIGIVVIGTVLANREMESSLAKALASEKESQKYAKQLEDQKGLLEIKVKDRTKALEESQRRRLRELQNFANMGKLSAGLIHDIANPLTIGLARVDEIESTVGKENKKTIVSLKNVLEKIQTITLNTRKQIAKQGTDAIFDAVKETQAVVTILSHRAVKDNVKIEFAAPKAITMVGDPVKFSQIILNLIMNAIESYEQVQDNRERVVEVDFKENKKVVTLTVRDYGFGIPTDTMDKIFDPLFTTKGESAGTGLGLYITREYTTSLNGKILAKSKLGEGTVFVLTFKRESK